MFYYHIQSRPGTMILVIEEQLDQSLNCTAWVVGLASSQIDNVQEMYMNNTSNILFQCQI